MREIGHDRHRPVVIHDALRVHLFGPVRLSSREHEVRLASRSGRALLAVLALNQRMRFRDAIAADIWPDLPESDASSALRQALWLVKSAMADAGLDPIALLDCDKERLGFRADVAIELDVARFEACMIDQPARVEEAIGLYGGDLAEGINLECLARDRERLADLFEDALADASQRRVLAGDLGRARDAALQLLHRDPLREEAHAVLIELYGLTGSRSQVSRQYRRLREILAAELNVEPLRETEDTYRTAIARAAARSSVRAMWSAVSSPHEWLSPGDVHGPA